MKEIDINIEGYNVNGICVGCLNYDRKMFYCDEIKECFKIVGNIDVPDGLNIQVCWECLAAVNKIIQFKSQILSSYNILIEYSRKQIFLNSPEDLTTHATTKLTTSPVDITDSTIVDIKQENGKNNAVCDEIIVDDRFDDELKTEEEKAFLEFDLDTIKPEPYEQTDTISDTFHDGDDSSNEDIQLSELRRRKVSKGRKRERGKRKNSEQKSQPVSRKLKNVPRDIVELYTMTEEEMWQVRVQDVASEHFEKLKYKCSDCIISFTSEKLRDYHVNGKHTPKTETSFACDVCKSYLLTKETLSVHRDKHLSAYKCKVCLKTSTIKAVMTQHACARNSEEHACVTCGKSFITKARLNYHKNICSQEKPQCDCCGKVFANKMTLKYHLKILPQNKEEKPKEKLYLPCKGCDKVFHSKKSYTAHVVIHSGVRYPCATCGKLFRWKRNLSRHARAHRERAAGAAHACAPCGKVFASRDCLHNHLRLSKAHVHPHALSHECSYCGKKFATKWCLVDHVDWDHLKKIKYQCSICFKAFKTAKIMVAHTNNIHGGRTKEDEGEHLCEICGKSYKTVKRLKGHVWAMHTQRSSTKSYKCKLCSATFTWQTSIYKHMKIMHDEGKRGKGRNVQNAVKKQEPFPDIELANRMQYFHQNLSSNLQSMSQAAHIQTLGAVPNAII